MRTLRNLTLHEQGDREMQLAAANGFVLESQPWGVEIGASFEEAVEKLAGRIRGTAELGHVALVGGHTGLWIAAVLKLQEAGLPLPPLYCFQTDRVRDRNGRFVFEPKGLVCVYVRQYGLSKRSSPSSNGVTCCGSPSQS